MQEVLAVRYTPQRRRAEFAARRRPLLETVGERWTHVVQQQIGEQERGKDRAARVRGATKYPI